MKLRLIGLSMLIATSLLASCSIIPSGIAVNKNFDNKDFSSVKVGSAFACTIAQGADYSVLIEVDQNLADSVEVTQIGTSLSIGLKPNISIGIASPVQSKVTITMPAIAGLELSGACTGIVSGFTGNMPALALGLSGASTLDWTGGQATAMSISVSGASTATLNSLTSDSTTIDVSGSSTLIGEAGTSTITELVLDISGASSASLDVSKSASGSVSGASRFSYGLSPALSIELSGASSMNPR